MILFYTQVTLNRFLYFVRSTVGQNFAFARRKPNAKQHPLPEATRRFCLVCHFNHTIGTILLAVTAATFVIPFAVAGLSMARAMPASWAYLVPGRAPRPGRALCAVPGAFLRIAEYRAGGRAVG